MGRPRLEVADIFCAHGRAYRQAHAGHLSLGQLKAMSAIQRCRTAELGGHLLHCPQCETDHIAYNSCRNRHCPKCQASAAKRWLTARSADLLPIEYYHVVFTLPEALREIACQNKTVVYDLLFKTVSETLLTIAADPKHLGAKIGLTAVLHTWGSTLSHHPHIHCIVTGGGLADDGQSFIACRPNFFLPVKVLSRLFQRRFLQQLRLAYEKRQLNFFGTRQYLDDPQRFTEHLKPLEHIDWVVYVKRPFAGPEAVLTYLSRYTHRVAISNARLIAFNDQGVTFKYKDYREKGRYRWKSMTLATDEFIRRFLLHILPKGFHRIRHYGLFTNSQRKQNLEKARRLLNQPAPPPTAPTPTPANESEKGTYTCPACGGPMTVIEVLTPNHAPRAPPNFKRAA